MGVQITDSAHVAIYCDTVDRPTALPIFSSADHARDFLSWARHRELGDVRELNAATGELAYMVWFSERTDEDGFLIEDPDTERNT